MCMTISEFLMSWVIGVAIGVVLIKLWEASR
jgi:hypothetical protein